MMKIIAALMLVLAVGCGGVGEDGGLCMIVKTDATWNSKKTEFNCNGDSYLGSCKIEHAPGGVDISCHCSVIYESNVGTKFSNGTVRITGNYNDNTPPDHPADFAEYVRSVPACEWWAPPI